MTYIRAREKIACLISGWQTFLSAHKGQAGMPVLLTLALFLASVASAEQPKPPTGATAAGQPRESSESLPNWQWYYEAPLPKANPDASPWLDFVLTPAVFDQARADLGDLRLYDAGGREVPYALRVRRTRDEQQQLGAREFNRQTNPDRSVELRLDLGENPVEHREIAIQTRGAEFHRRVQLEGSDDGQNWGLLIDQGWLVCYRVQSRDVDIHKLTYAPSRYRYLRVRVFPDLSTTDDAPAIASVAAYHIVRIPGEYVTLSATHGLREPTPTPGGPGSKWPIDLSGEQVPCEKLTFEVDDKDFVRPYVLEQMAGEGYWASIGRGEWRRRAGSKREPLEIQFSEIAARRLRLLVTDNRNPPLDMVGVQYTAPAREVVFARSEQLAGPLRLYVGNPKAEPPRYDFAANLPEVLAPIPQRIERLGERMSNPVYQPEPKPFSERWPWLVYAVLATASVILLGMLAILARRAVVQHDATASAEREAVS